MKFSHYLSAIEGVGIYPVISLLIFTVFFSVVVWRIMKINATEIERIEKLPLDDN